MNSEKILCWLLDPTTVVVVEPIKAGSWPMLYHAEGYPDCVSITYPFCGKSLQHTFNKPVLLFFCFKLLDLR